MRCISNGLRAASLERPLPPRDQMPESGFVVVKLVKERRRIEARFSNVQPSVADIPGL